MINSINPHSLRKSLLYNNLCCVHSTWKSSIKLKSLFKIQIIWVLQATYTIQLMKIFVFIAASIFSILGSISRIWIWRTLIAFVMELRTLILMLKAMKFVTMFCDSLILIPDLLIESVLWKSFGAKLHVSFQIRFQTFFKHISSYLYGLDRTKREAHWRSNSGYSYW